MGQVAQLSEVFVSDYIQLFLNEKKEYNNSQKTYNSYLSDVKSFFSFKVGNINDYDDLRKLVKNDLKLEINAIRKYRTFLTEELGNSNNTINRKVTSIRGLYEFLYTSELVTENDMKAFANIKSLKVHENSYGILDEDTSLKIIQFLRNYKTRGRNKCLTRSNFVKFMLQTSARMTATLNVKLSDFTKTNNDYLVTVKDKGSVVTKKHISNNFYSELLEMYEKEGKGNGYLFNISDKALNDMMKVIREEFHINDDENITIHSFRKVALSHVYESTDKDLNKTRVFAGHANFNSIDRYLRSEENEDYGMITSYEQTSQDLYKEVPHEELLNVISQLDSATIMKINKLLKK